MDAIYATPFIPGVARGPLARESEPSPEALVMVTFDQLSRFRGSAAGLIVIGTAPLSHPMLRLSVLEVPTVIVTPDQADRLRSGDVYVVDGTHGIVVDARQWERGAGRELSQDAPEAGRPLATRDGTLVELRASITGVEGARQARRSGATAIGIVRSEYFMPADGTRPDADFFRDRFTALCQAADGLQVTVRSIDLAPDKVPEWLPSIHGMRGLLGLRGARLYDTEPVRSVFLDQARAAGELVADCDIRLMLPYLVQMEEYRRWLADIRGVAPEILPVGVMAETPAAALAVDEWLQQCDFVSLGCNDLMQCLFGADREIPELADLLDPYAPVLFRFLRHVAAIAGHRVGELQVCGLLSRVPRILPVLLGLGFRRFSLEPHLIPVLARTVRATDLDTAEALANAVCAETDAGAVRTMLGLRGAGAWREDEETARSGGTARVGAGRRA